jgi:hypothetical protein
LNRLARRNRPIDRFLLDGSSLRSVHPRRNAAEAPRLPDQTIKTVTQSAATQRLAIVGFLLISRRTHRAHAAS